MSLTDVEEAVEQAAEAIAELPPQEWPGWVVYLMMVLDEQHPPEGMMQENLEAIRADIEARLREGRW
jgi:hypothetical protein